MHFQQIPGTPGGPGQSSPNWGSSTRLVPTDGLGIIEAVPA